MSNVRHRVAFNCDLFITLMAPEEATTADLERLVVAALRSAQPEAAIPDIGIVVQLHSDLEHLDELDPIIYPRVVDSEVEDDKIQFENFTIENVDARGGSTVRVLDTDL